MGVRTTLYRVDLELFVEIRKRRRLRRMIDVFKGKESPQALDLDPEYHFPPCHLGQAWDDFVPLLKGINKSLIVQGFRGWSHAIKHRKCRAFYWEPVEVIWCLSNVWFAVGRMDKRIRAYATRPNLGPEDYGNIVHEEDLDLAFGALKALIEKRWRREEAWLDDGGSPFERERLDDVFRHLCQAVRFMTASVTEGLETEDGAAGEVIVGVTG